VAVAPVAGQVGEADVGGEQRGLVVDGGGGRRVPGRGGGAGEGDDPGDPFGQREAGRPGSGDEGEAAGDRDTPVERYRLVNIDRFRFSGSRYRKRGTDSRNSLRRRHTKGGVPVSLERECQAGGWSQLSPAPARRFIVTDILKSRSTGSVLTKLAVFGFARRKRSDGSIVPFSGGLIALALVTIPAICGLLSWLAYLNFLRFLVRESPADPQWAERARAATVGWKFTGPGSGDRPRHGVRRAFQPVDRSARPIV
jgi:hypothetical protein